MSIVLVDEANVHKVEHDVVYVKDGRKTHLYPCDKVANPSDLGTIYSQYLEVAVMRTLVSTNQDGNLILRFNGGDHDDERSLFNQTLETIYAYIEEMEGRKFMISRALLRNSELGSMEDYESPIDTVQDEYLKPGTFQDL